MVQAKDRGFSFQVSVHAVMSSSGALRPLRDPDAPELDEDDQGGDSYAHIG
ncbi:hypothetical protein OOK27_22475 [Streptomyces canus]|uniref:hypothetical protein n=1 Tax=Streptomyces canus TaxID=58343 RepID=UPI00224DC26C|nr:hypothetical protein [Streptomyces canus]MCX5256863.1 hypothetical protein [Streptomyces canus]